MEHFSQEDVDRMIQEAAQAAKNKKGSPDGKIAKPAGAKPVSNVSASPQQSVDPVEEVLASMNQAPADTKIPDPPSEEPKKPEQATSEDAKPKADEPVQEPAAEQKPTEPEKSKADPVAEAMQQAAPENPIEEKIAQKAPNPTETPAEPKQVQVQEKTQAEEIAQPEPESKDTEMKETQPDNGSQSIVPEPQTTQPSAADIEPSFTALSSEQIYTFVMALIKDLAEAKVELAKMQVDLEIEKLNNQVASLFKNTK
ncbi:hypothetical protein J7L67_09960 [bacterium]|nr:hypothetical protein [bacterium]